MLHNVVYNTSKKFLLENTSYDYIYFNNPRKVRIYEDLPLFRPTVILLWIHLLTANSYKEIMILSI